MEPEPVTVLLKRAGSGDSGAAAALYAALYDDLRRQAEQLMGRHPSSFTLQPTAVVHEAWIRLCAADEPDWRERGHFLAVAAKAMRSVLVDHARRRRAQKRGGDRARVAWDDALAEYEERAVDLLALDAALERFGRLDPELARLVELRFFGGLTIDETAAQLGVSTATVERGWRTARAWLRAELGGEGEGADGP